MGAAEDIRDVQPTQKQLFEKYIWTIDDVCLITGYSKGTIYNKISRGEIPYKKTMRKVHFIPDEILGWIQGE